MANICLLRSISSSWTRSPSSFSISPRTKLTVQLATWDRILISFSSYIILMSWGSISEWNFIWMWGDNTLSNRPKAIKAAYLTLGCSSKSPLATIWIVPIISFLKVFVQVSAIIPKNVKPAYLNCQDAWLFTDSKMIWLEHWIVVFSPN